jgi:hypothetical protein
MANKRFWLGMLVMVLAFGITVIGCEPDNGNGETDTTPLPPTGLNGTVDGNSVQLTWNSVENASEYSLEFKKTYGTSEYQAIDNITLTSYTVTGLDSNTDYNFRVAALNTKGEKSGFFTVFTIKTSNSKTGTVFINSFSTTQRTQTVSGNPNYSYSITVELELSNGAFWKWESGEQDTVNMKVQTWVDLIPPSGFIFDSTSVGLGSSESKIIRVRYSSSINSSARPAPNLTVNIDQNKLLEMKGYTNITESLTLGTPSTASSNAWVYSN